MLPGRRARAGAGGKDANLGRQHYVLPLLKIVPPLLDAIFPVFAAPATPVGVTPAGANSYNGPLWGRTFLSLKFARMGWEP
jgi:hypothetical protein